MDADALRLADYARQSGYSEPGRHAELFDDVQPAIESVSAMARNVVVHYKASGLDLPRQSRPDVDLRWIEAILSTDQQRHHAPLDNERPVEARVQGCCRDHSLLAVAALRHHNVPARTRVGFASYLFESWHYDHVIVEVWVEGRWRRFDPEVAEPLPALPDPTDIPTSPDGPFLTAAQVWLGHRPGSSTSLATARSSTPHYKVSRSSTQRSSARLPGDRSRLVVGGYQAMRPPWLERFVNFWVYPPVHWMMQTRQFANLKRNIETSGTSATVKPEEVRKAVHHG